MLLLLAFAQATVAAEDDFRMAVPIDGEPFAARLVSINERWEIVFQTATGPRKLHAAELATWGRCAEPVRGPWIVLRDGGVIVADALVADREVISSESSFAGKLRLARLHVAGMVFRLPPDREQRDRIADWVSPPSTGPSGKKGLDTDRARLINGDEVAGTLDRVEAGTIRWIGGAGPVELDAARVEAVRFASPSGPRAAEKHAPVKRLSAWSGWRDGSRALVASITTGGSAVQAKLLDGSTWNADLGALVFLQPLGDRVVYLSDLEADSYRHVPYLSLSWPFHADRNAAGGLLRHGGAIHLKGLGMHSAARLTYVLSESYRRFQAEAAIDDCTEGRGSVGFRVFVDGQMRYASPVVRGGQPPVPVAIDLAGARRLDLVVDFAERADEQDYANWLNARLIR